MTSKAKKKSDIHKLQDEFKDLKQQLDNIKAAQCSTADVIEGIKADATTTKYKIAKLFASTDELFDAIDTLTGHVKGLHKSVPITNPTNNTHSPLSFAIEDDDEWLRNL